MPVRARRISALFRHPLVPITSGFLAFVIIDGTNLPMPARRGRRRRRKETEVVQPPAVWGCRLPTIHLQIKPAPELSITPVAFLS
jgi:hypothetical protein